MQVYADTLVYAMACASKEKVENVLLCSGEDKSKISSVAKKRPAEVWDFICDQHFSFAKSIFSA